MGLWNSAAEWYSASIRTGAAAQAAGASPRLSGNSMGASWAWSRAWARSVAWSSSLYWARISEAAWRAASKVSATTRAMGWPL